MDPKVGVALAVHNSSEQTRECLDALLDSDYDNLHIVVVDDGSSDGTWEMLHRDYPNVTALRGDGNLWWTGGTNLAIRRSLNDKCDFVLLLNPDVIVEPKTISTLVHFSILLDRASVCPIVLDYDSPDRIWEAGHTWGPIIDKIPVIWVGRQIYKRGTKITALPSEPYATVGIIGRGGLVPRSVFETLGLFDAKRLPHYGADVDFGRRVWQNGFSVYVIPKARVLLHTDHTGMTVPHSPREAVLGYVRYLLSRKHGEKLRVLFLINMSHLPIYAAIPSFLFELGINSFRYWQAFLTNRKSAR